MKKQNTVSNLLYMIKLIWETSPIYVIVNILYTFENIPRRLLNVYIVKYIADAVFLGTPFDVIVKNGVLFLIAELLLTLLKNCYNRMYKAPKEQEVRAHIKKILFEKVKNLDIENYDNKEFYDKYTLAFCSAEETAFAVFNGVIRVLSALISITTLASYILILSPPIILVSLCGSLVSLITDFVMNKYRVKQQKEGAIVSRKIKYVSDIYEARGNATDIRMGRITGLLDRFFDSAYKDRCKLERKYGRKYAVCDIMGNVPLDIADIFMWLYIAHEILRGVLQAGDFMSLTNAGYSLDQQLRMLFKTLPMLHELSLRVEYIKDIDLYKSKLFFTGNGQIEENKIFDIDVRNIWFAYEDNKNVLRDVSFHVKSGEKVALVGHNGAGKSTLVKLLLRLYDPQKGTLFLNGQPYHAFELQKLRNLFAVIFQDFQFYAFSVAENILMRTPENEEDYEKVNTVLKKVGLYFKVQALPNGSNTQLAKTFDNEGVVLSGGELQRLAVARALACDAPIVIMDEPSSALDPIAEREMTQLLMEVFREKVVLIISHRLSLTKGCDRIMVIDNGEIVEKGTHSSLLEKGGKYAQLWQSQAEYYS